MTNRLDRDELISLLETLGSDNDEEALAAARVLDTKVAAAATSWDKLLTSGLGRHDTDPAGADPEGADPDDDAEDAGTQTPIAPDAAGRNAQTLAMIDKLLARGDHSQEFRQELEDYKTDIAAGEFDDGDHSYVRALYKRLTG